MYIRKTGGARKEAQKENLKKLWVRQDGEELWKAFRKKQFQGTLLGAALALLLLVGLLPGIGDSSFNGIDLKRPEVPWRSRVYELNVRYKNEEKKISIEVKGKAADPEKMNHYFTAARDLFWKQMVGENQTEDHITENLNFSPTAAGTEFTAAFRPEDFSVIGADGTLLGGRKETKTVKIFLDIQGGEEKRSYETEVTVYPEERSEEEELEDYIKGAEGVNRAQELFELPQEFKGDRLSYEEKKKESVWPLAAICIILLPGIMWYMPVQKQKEALKRRERQLLEDYPDLVLKFSLLLKAGLTIRNVWQKIGEDYDREVNRTGIRYAYEEIWQSACRMKAGVPEREEYQNFGMRCGLHPYLRLSALLEQNLQKGNKSLLSLLQGEQIQAFEERKNQIRKLGEEAGTKLLGPMMLYFLIVLMILLIPAWLSFSI